jgi:hypothetical protein
MIKDINSEKIQMLLKIRFLAQKLKFKYFMDQIILNLKLFHFGFSL